MRAWLVEGLRFDALEQPLVGLAALALAGFALLRAWRSRPAALPWPAWSEALAAGAGRDVSRTLACALRFAALALLAGVLAGPVSLRRAPPASDEGLDVALVIDASGSMRALDAELAGAWRTRLDLAKQVVARFALDRVAEGDRVGLVVFGRSALTQCPLTSDGDLLAAALSRVESGMAGEATALGDALTLAVRRLTRGEDAGAIAPTGPAAGRVVVLLSDGRSNAGSVPTDVATAVAVARGVRVHTVGIGSEGEVPVALPAEAGGRAVRFERHDLDEVTLEAIARATGGRYFPARSSRDLEAVYAEIDALERVVRQAPARRRRSARPEPYLALAGLLVVIELVTARGVTRHLP